MRRRVTLFLPVQPSTLWFCPSQLQVGLRAVPVRSLALDAAVGVFERLLPEGERVDLRNRIESGRSAVNKMVKMLWWLQPPLMPALGSQGTQAALGTQDNHRPDAAAGGGGSSHTGHHHQQRDQQPSQSHQSRNEMSRRSSGGASLPPAVPQVTSRSHSFSGGHPHLGHNHSAGGPHGSSNSFSGGGHPFSSSNSFSNNGSSSGGDGSFTRQSSSAGHGGPRRSSPGPVPQGSNAWRQAQQHQQHQFVPQQQVQQQQQYQQVEPLRSNNRSMSMPLADPMPFLGLQHQLPVLFPPALSHQHQQEQAALLQRLTELGPYAPSGRSSQSGFELPLQHSYGQLTMGGAQDSLDLPPLEGACNSGLPLDLEQHSFSHGDAAGLPLGMQAEVLNMLRNIYLQ